MKSINIRFIGHDHLLLDFCKSYLSRYSFIKCKPILQPKIFMKLQIIKTAEVVFVDLPADSCCVFEFGIQLKRIYPRSKIVAFAHRADLREILNLQHINKLFEFIIERDSAVEDLDRLVTKFRLDFNLRAKDKSLLNFTPREKDVIKLTCMENENHEIASKLRISHRTVETHKTNIYSKLGGRNAAKLFNYATYFGLI